MQDKVNMSVAILPMAQEFGWSPSVAGLVQSSFFWGYMLSQIPAGYLANKFSGRWVLPGGVGLWSGFTAGVPLLTSTLPSLCVSRAAVGFGEGVAPSAVNDIVAKTVPQNERGRAISTIFGGLHIGSILGLLLAPQFIKAFGWESVFYAFGALGLVWIVGFEMLLSDPSKQVQDMRRLDSFFCSLEPVLGCSSFIFSLRIACMGACGYPQYGMNAWTHGCVLIPGSCSAR
jgi:MFS transporter, ACS family, solute carrier family 17 (sodium-dependent inorganic phosphate cotransporter), other